MIGALRRVLGDFDAAEDAVQDAFVAALERWPQDGVPDRPGAWILTTARHKAIDRARREAHRADKQAAAHRSLAALDGWDEPDTTVLRDDLLRLVFVCCHPALPDESRVALALKTLCGLRTEEAARLLLTSETALAQRIVRAKRRLAADDIAFEVPAAHELPDRLPAVLATVHLLFTEGHTASSGDAHVRVELCDEALRLAARLGDLMPDEPEVLGLHALLLITDARRATRVDARGELVLLADQDRAAWNHAAIESGVALVERALRQGRVGRYQLEAAIAACHATAASFATTDWAEIAALYALLDELAPSPVVTLNRAVAIAEAFDPQAALDHLSGLAGELDDHHLRWAVEADLRTRLGDTAGTTACLRRALACSHNAAETRHLERRLAALA